jgi:hypothetical protein
MWFCASENRDDVVVADRQVGRLDLVDDLVGYPLGVTYSLGDNLEDEVAQLGAFVGVMGLRIAGRRRGGQGELRPLLPVAAPDSVIAPRGYVSTPKR